MSLLTENGSTKDDLRLPTDEAMLAQVSARYMSAVCFMEFLRIPILLLFSNDVKKHDLIFRKSNHYHPHVSFNCLE